MSPRTFTPGPPGRQLLAGSPEAVAYCMAMAPIAFPDGLPSAIIVDLVRRAVWDEARRHDDERPAGAVAWNPETEAALRVGDAFRLAGLAGAFAAAGAHERRGAHPPDAPPPAGVSATPEIRTP